MFYNGCGNCPILFRKSVCVLLLVASKAFVKVSFEKLFEILLSRNVCPRIIKLLLYMYMNKKCHVKWANELSESFTVANGVKQGAVICCCCCRPTPP